MSKPVLLKASLPVAAVSLLQSVLPAALAGGSLAIVAWFRGVPFDRFYLALACVAAVMVFATMRPADRDSPTVSLQFAQLLLRTGLGWGLTVALLVWLGRATEFDEAYSRAVIVPWVLAVAPLIFTALVILQWLMRRIVTSRRNVRSAVFVGANPTSIRLAEILDDEREWCIRVEGFFDDRSPERLKPLGSFSLLGPLGNLVEHVKRDRIDLIFVALPIRHIQRVMSLIDALQDSTASIYYVPDVFVFDLIQSRSAEINGIPVVAMCETPFYGYRGVLKRLTDLVFTICILLLALPLMLVIALMVKLSSPGPVIFKQRRYGLDGEEIKVYKFRSMRVVEDGPNVVQATKNDPRVTPIGRLLRRYSLDELPQLINVLQGRMSLVGPRPHAVAHNEQYRKLIKGYMFRHKVLPGITGLAQISGFRGETAELAQMQARVHYDLEYLRQWSPWLDLKILLVTVVKLFRDTHAY